MILAHESGVHISPLDAYLYLVAAFLFAVIILGIGILIGYFLMRSAEKYHPVPHPSQQTKGRAPHTRSTTTQGRERHERKP